MRQEFNCKSSEHKTQLVTALSSMAMGMLVLLLFSLPASAQWTGLRVQGQQIVDQNGTNVILKGFGIGEMYNTEAYMLEWPDGNGGKSRWYYGYTRIHDTITKLAGESVDNQFTAQWEANILTDADVATWQSWGVNSIRFSINYHWLSPQNGVYLNSGWAKIDNFIALCKKHNIKVILCMHAAPGAQNPELMSDTVDGKPHLWTEPTVYQPWTINLWQTIAQRYANETAVAGYDLLDEPLLSESNPSSGGSMVRTFYVQLTAAIRTVDKNHILFACGTEWCGSTAGMKAILPTWDNNMVLVFHKYWDKNDTASIQGFLDIRSQHNVPIWNGETGENNDTWAKGMADLLAANNVGWSWWTIKKVNGTAGNAGNNTQPYEIPEPAKYSEVLNYVKTFGSGTPPSQPDANSIFMRLAANAATAKCKFNGGLITALFRP
jgi:endoglucanase